MRILKFVLALLLSMAADARPVRGCFFGDSIGAGFSPSTMGTPTQLVRLHGGEDFGVKQLAISGYTSTSVQAAWATDGDGRGCTHVLVLIGTNDLASVQTADNIYARVNVVAQAAEAQGAIVVLAAVPPRATAASFTLTLELQRVSLNAMLAARAGSVYVDTSTALTGTAVATASAPAWAASTGYGLGNTRVNGGKAYIVTTAGTSAGSEGPTGTGTDITDGTVHWRYVPALGSEYGGATDGVHVNNAGQAAIAAAIDAAVIAAGGWQ